MLHTIKDSGKIIEVNAPGAELAARQYGASIAEGRAVLVRLIEGAASGNYSLSIANEKGSGYITRVIEVTQVQARPDQDLWVNF